MSPRRQPNRAITELNAFVIKPRNFDPSKKYPLLMWAYGGPGSQTVLDAWGGAYYLWGRAKKSINGEQRRQLP